MHHHRRRMLSEWFSVGLLDMRQITWERTPAALLEKVPALALDLACMHGTPGHACIWTHDLYQGGHGQSAPVAPTMAGILPGAYMSREGWCTWRKRR